MFASISDIQTWPREDRIDVNEANAAKPAVDADRTIRGQIAGVFTPIVISGWDAPDNTPEIIRSIAGRLTAAYLIRNLYSEEGADVPAYATELYLEAIKMLADIRSGTLTVVDANNVPVPTASSSLDLSFWPDDSTLPVFTMDQTFA